LRTIQTRILSSSALLISTLSVHRSSYIYVQFLHHIVDFRQDPYIEISGRPGQPVNVLYNHTLKVCFPIQQY